MKALIVSDSHGVGGFLKKAIEKTKDFDVFIHLGDMSGKENEIREMASPYVKDENIHIIRGNNDWGNSLPREEVFNIGKNKVWITHGHRYLVSVYEDMIRDEARNREVRIVMYGHTHVPSVTDNGGIMTINPGSISQPRQSGRFAPTYAVLELDNMGNPQVVIQYLD